MEQIIIAGMATAMVVGFVVELLDSVINPKFLKMILTIPTALGALWLLGIEGYSLVVFALAAGFFSTAVLHILNRATTVANVITRR